ncbi:hypothetical protein [Xenophilus sp. Marseille-Q4582]|uniref:hypothetical protein n=1 Tax=Xenophilus sp. Marseille-Q4582 TaxID=2866600 RepID=UPI001CE468A3|nr:hypothetical protein [Xenophilus sp. Marseille-Q4582]
MTDRIEVAPGVMRLVSYSRAIYIGSAEALVAAGVAQRHHFPGQPGNPRGMCSFDPAGVRVTKGYRGRERGGPGHVRIVARREGFEVELRLSPQRLEGIEAERAQAAKGWPFPIINGMPAGAAKNCRLATFLQEVKA